MKRNLFQLLFVVILMFVGGGKAIAADIEQELAMRVQEAQVSGNDSAFYSAHQAFLDHIAKNQDWEKYYRVWMNRVIYDVNNKHFHRAFNESNKITDDIRERRQEQ